MKIKKEYTFTNKRQIWRVIPTESDKIIVEERDIEKKEVFFNSFEIKTGKILFKNFQYDEKYWIGIESIYNEIIFFHRFAKPDMPGHLGIIAFDINNQKILWKNDQLSFLFVYNNKVYCFIQKFESREFLSLDFLSGIIIENFGEDFSVVNKIKEEYLQQDFYKNFRFPSAQNSLNEEINNYLQNIKENNLISGPIEFIEYFNLLITSFHEITGEGKLNNVFKIFNIKKDKILLSETINKDVKAIVNGSFFMKDNFIILLKEKVMLEVYLIKE